MVRSGYLVNGAEVTTYYVYISFLHSTYPVTCLSCIVKLSISSSGSTETNCTSNTTAEFGGICGGKPF